jgi:hypothetical protein
VDPPVFRRMGEWRALAQLAAGGPTAGWCVVTCSADAPAPAGTRVVLLEGHARLTAVFVGGLQRRLTVRAYLGLSPALGQWGCF